MFLQASVSDFSSQSILWASNVFFFCVVKAGRESAASAIG